MSQRNTLLLFFVSALVVCAFDAYSALHGRGGHVTVAWVLAGVMAIIAILILRKLLMLPREDERRP